MKNTETETMRFYNIRMSLCLFIYIYTVSYFLTITQCTYTLKNVGNYETDGRIKIIMFSRLRRDLNVEWKRNPFQMNQEEMLQRKLYYLFQYVYILKYMYNVRFRVSFNFFLAMLRLHKRNLT